MRMGMMSGIPRKHAHTNLLSISYSGNPFLSLSPAGAYPAYGSLPFTFRTCSELRTAKNGLTAAWPQWPPAKVQAGTRLVVGFPRNAQSHAQEKFIHLMHVLHKGSYRKSMAAKI